MSIHKYTLCVRVCECVYVAVWLWIVYRILNGIRCKAIGMMKNVSLSLSFRSQFDRSVRSSPIATRLTERILYVRCTQGIESRTFIYICVNSTTTIEIRATNALVGKRKINKEFLFWWLFLNAKNSLWCALSHKRTYTHPYIQSTWCATVVHVYKCIIIHSLSTRSVLKPLRFVVLLLDASRTHGNAFNPILKILPFCFILCIGLFHVESSSFVWIDQLFRRMCRNLKAMMWMISSVSHVWPLNR